MSIKFMNITGKVTPLSSLKGGLLFPVLSSNLRKIEKSPFEGGLRGMTLLLLLALLPLVALAQQPDSTGTGSQLDRYLAEAAQSNPELEARFYEYRSVLEQIPQAGSLPDPEVMFMYFINPRTYSNPLSRMTVSATQMLPWFGTLNTAEKRIQNIANARLDEFTDTRNRLFRDVKEVWFRMYEISHHARVLRNNLELLNMLESTAISMYETGNTSQVDLIRIQIETDKIDTRIKQMEEKLIPLQIKFNALLNRDSRAAIDMSMPMEQNALILSRDEIVQKIRSQNPRLSRLGHHREAAGQALKNARRDGLPSFGLGLEAMLPDYMYMPMMPGDRTALVAKLTIKVPLYRSRYNAQQREAKLNIRSIEAQQIDIGNKLLADTEERLQEHQDAQYRIDLYENKLIPKTRQALEIALDTYSAGNGNFEELIQLQRQILDYEMDLNTAYVERNIVLAELEYLYGKYNANPEKIEY